MKLHSIKIQPNGECLDLPDGCSLTEIDEIKVGIIAFTCRSGCCGSCAIEVISGGENLSPIGIDEKEFLQSLGYEPEMTRLACQCEINGPITISPVG